MTKRRARLGAREAYDRWSRTYDAALSKPPGAYGLGIVEGEGVRFPHVNQGEHLLPAVVLALVCGYRKGTRVIQLSRDQLDRAIDLLAPAEACTIYCHPNLWAWRTMRAEAGPEATYVAVFVGDLADPVTDEHDAVFPQHAGGAGQ